MDTVAVAPPSQKTLDKYGLTEADWWAILERQGGICPICHKVPTTGRFVVDHDHVRGWKKLPPEERKRYCRGLVCWFDNHYYLGRSITIEKSRNVTAYLEQYQARRPENVGGLK